VPLKTDDVGHYVEFAWRRIGVGHCDEFETLRPEVDERALDGVRVDVIAGELELNVFVADESRNDRPVAASLFIGHYP
jgi:hypothetical protein